MRALIKVQIEEKKIHEMRSLLANEFPCPASKFVTVFCTSSSCSKLDFIFKRIREMVAQMQMVLKVG